MEGASLCVNQAFRNLKQPPEHRTRYRKSCLVVTWHIRIRPVGALTSSIGLELEETYVPDSRYLHVLPLVLHR